MSSNQSLNCFRCEKIATVFIPYNNRALCDTHLATFKEAYSFVNFASILINENNIEAINELVPKQATQVSELESVVEKTHEVPVQLIVDHLGELATGVEPATCKICRKPMQLHAQFATTKQKDQNASNVSDALEKAAAAGDATPSDQELQEVARPDFLTRFADGGRGVCLTCGGTGFQLFPFPRNIRDIYSHLNDDRKHDGHYNQLMDYSSRFRGFTKKIATDQNLPFYVTKIQNFAPNPDFDPNYLSDFGMPKIVGYGEIDFTNEPHRNLHSFLHAIGNMDFIFDAAHDHSDVKSLEELFALKDLPKEEADKKMLSPFCSSCFGHGSHPLSGHEEFEEYLQEMNAKAAESSRDIVRRRKTKKPSSPGVTKVIDLSTLQSGETSLQREGHAGPNIKPHDHHNKPHTYKKHEQSPGSGSSGTSQVKKKKSPSSGGGGRGRGKGSNPFALAPRKRNFFEKFPVEKWIYNAMNAVHDMTHTVYENPSYMYRNPNPMYYSVPRAQWGMAKPWRN